MSHPRVLMAVLQAALEEMRHGSPWTATKILEAARVGDYSWIQGQGITVPFVHPSHMERLVGAAKLYVAAMDGTTVGQREIIEAGEQLQEAVLSYDVARWLAALDD